MQNEPNDDIIEAIKSFAATHSPAFDKTTCAIVVLIFLLHTLKLTVLYRYVQIIYMFTLQHRITICSV